MNAEISARENAAFADVPRLNLNSRPSIAREKNFNKRQNMFDNDLRSKSKGLTFSRLDEPDLRLREIAIKQNSGVPLNASDIRRLAQRQGVEREYQRMANASAAENARWRSMQDYSGRNTADPRLAPFKSQIQSPGTMGDLYSSGQWNPRLAAAEAGAYRTSLARMKAEYGDPRFAQDFNRTSAMQSAQSNDLRLREMRRRDDQIQSLQDFRRWNEHFLESPYDADGLQRIRNMAVASGNIAAVDYYDARLAAARNAEIEAQRAQAQADAEAFRRRMQEDSQDLAHKEYMLKVEKFRDLVDGRNSPLRSEVVYVGGKPEYFVRGSNGFVSRIPNGSEVEQRMSLPQVLMYNGGMVPLYIEDAVHGKKLNPEYVEAAKVVLGARPEYQFLLNGLNQGNVAGEGAGNSQANTRIDEINKIQEDLAEGRITRQQAYDMMKELGFGNE